MAQKTSDTIYGAIGSDHSLSSLHTPEAGNAPRARRSLLTVFASVKMTITLLVLIATSVLVGAWCPQESQVGMEKVVEQFGEEWAFRFNQWGITDIFHTPWFLLLIGLLSLNMVACSVQRVFPKIRSLKQPLPWLKQKEIARLPVNVEVILPAGSLESLNIVALRLRSKGYKVHLKGSSLVAEWGKIGRLAPTVTHIGLLTLLLGVTITSWTGFSGFQPVQLGKNLGFKTSEHSKLWVGKLPAWSVHVNSTRREDYPSGDPKQWYSDLSVIDQYGKELKRQEISVNDPLSYDGVDIYQSSWGLDKVDLSFNQHPRLLQLRPMGKLYAAFLPLDPGTILIFSVKNLQAPLRLFAKTADWQSPRLITEIPPGQAADLGSVNVHFNQVIPATGLQYKCDPGLPITYVAFGFIISGVLLATIPHRQLWAYVQATNDAGDLNQTLKPAAASIGSPGIGSLESQGGLLATQAGVAVAELANAEPAVINQSSAQSSIWIGGRAMKGKAAFEKSVHKIVLQLQSEMGEPSHV